MSTTAKTVAAAIKLPALRAGQRVVINAHNAGNTGRVRHEGAEVAFVTPSLVRLFCGRRMFELKLDEQGRVYNDRRLDGRELVVSVSIAA